MLWHSKQQPTASAKAAWLGSNKNLLAAQMDEQLDIDAEVLFRFVGHKFDNNPMVPVLFKDVITASDRSDGHVFPNFDIAKAHAYWFHGFQFTLNRDGKITRVPPPHRL